MDSMYDIATTAMTHMPPTRRFRPTDGEVLRRHSELLLSAEDDLVTSFYESLFNHPPTAAVFVHGERDAREAEFRGWWRRTVNGPVDDDYFAWMAMVGLIHVVRGVSNPMMLTMTDHVTVFVADRAATAELSDAERTALVDAFARLSTTVGAIITHGYDSADQAVVTALFNTVGMPEALLKRLWDQEVVTAVADARRELARERSA